MTRREWKSILCVRVVVCIEEIEGVERRYNKDRAGEDEAEKVDEKMIMENGAWRRGAIKRYSKKWKKSFQKRKVWKIKSVRMRTRLTYERRGGTKGEWIAVKKNSGRNMRWDEWEMRGRNKIWQFEIRGAIVYNKARRREQVGIKKYHIHKRTAGGAIRG